MPLVKYSMLPILAGGTEVGDNSINAEMLAFSLDKKSYNVGEIVKLDLPNFTSGRALVSVESSTGVVSSFWVTNEEAKNGIELEATSAMTPNVFIHVALVQPHSVKEMIYL